MFLFFVNFTSDSINGCLEKLYPFLGQYNENWQFWNSTSETDLTSRIKMLKKCDNAGAVCKMIFFQRLSSIKGCLLSKVVLHQRVSSMKGRLPSKVIFHERSSSIKGRLPSKVVFHQRLSSIKGRLPSKVVFHWRSSSTPELPPRYPHVLSQADALTQNC